MIGRVPPETLAEQESRTASESEKNVKVNMPSAGSSRLRGIHENLPFTATIQFCFNTLFFNHDACARGTSFSGLGQLGIPSRIRV